jgi:O-antigen/teichoic acid export membrane protein
MTESRKSFDAARPQRSPSMLGGAAWLTVAPFGKSLTQFLASIVLARLLPPEDFGIAAIAMSIVLFATLFTELGIMQAVVQRPELTRAYISSAFWMNVLSGIGVAAVVFASGPAIAEFYDEPSLSFLIGVASISLVASFGVVHQGTLDRDYAFKRVAIVDLARALIGSGVSLMLALRGFGPVALVAGPAVGALFGSIAMMALGGWIPTFRVRRDDLAAIWGFSKPLVATNVVTFAARASDVLLLARAHPPSVVGLYQRGMNLGTLPAVQLSGPISRFLLAHLSRRKPTDVVVALEQAIFALAIVTMPFAVIMAWFSGPILETLYGEVWGAAAPVLSIIVFLVPFRLFRRAVFAGINASGDNRAILYIGLVVSTLTLAGVAATAHVGPEAVAASIVLADGVGTLISIKFVKRSLPSFGGRRLMRLMLSPLLGSLIVAAFAVASVETGLGRGASSLALLTATLAFLLTVVLIDGGRVRALLKTLTRRDG